MLRMFLTIVTVTRTGTTTTMGRTGSGTTTGCGQMIGHGRSIIITVRCFGGNMIHIIMIIASVTTTRSGGRSSSSITWYRCNIRCRTTSGSGSSSSRSTTLILIITGWMIYFVGTFRRCVHGFFGNSIQREYRYITFTTIGRWLLLRPTLLCRCGWYNNILIDRCSAKF